MNYLTALRLTWSTLDTLNYREADRDLWVEAKMRQGRQIQIAPTDLGGRYFALCGFWEPQVTKAINRTSRHGLLVDIGANFGYFSALWLTHPDTHVIAVKPSREFIPIVRANLAGFGNRGSLFEGVVGDATGTVSFAGRGMTGTIVAEEAVDGYKVAMTTLSDLLAGEFKGKFIEVLKIDAEGYDLIILNANRDLFSQRRVGLVLWEKARTQDEQNFVNFLQSAGYRLVLNSFMFG